MILKQFFSANNVHIKRKKKDVADNVHIKRKKKRKRKMLLDGYLPMSQIPVSKINPDF